MKIYLSFTLLGLMDLITHYKKELIPHNTNTVFLLLIFMMELIVLRGSENSNMLYVSRQCQVLTVIASLTCCFAHLVSRTTSWYYLCQATLTQVQGSWTFTGNTWLMMTDGQGLIFLGTCLQYSLYTSVLVPSSTTHPWSAPKYLPD